jgi:hypothetical protein
MNMKKIFIIFSLLAVTFNSVIAQESTVSIERFRTAVLPQFKIYFTEADLTANGQLKLTSTSGFISLSRENKNTVMDMLVRSWQTSLIRIENGATRELWGLNGRTGKAMLIESWTTEGITEAKPAELPLSKTSQHPWFVYFGFQFQMDSQQNVNMGLNTRVGFFLLKNRWDLAATASGFMLGNLESESQNVQSGVGISSKVYFPIPKLRISPNIGGEVSYSSYTIEETTSSSVTPYGLAGISWYVGNGSFDVNVRIGKEALVMLGYTFIPKLNSSK